MRPEAHVAAATDILDDILSGAPAERSLTNWARRSRFAGSGDRAAIRDLVFGALRRKRSLAWLGGGETGRGLMIGWVRETGAPLEKTFTGAGYGPPPLSEAELAGGQALERAPDAVRLDCPDWLFPVFEMDHGADFAAILSELRNRAPIFLRVNAIRGTREAAMEVLSEDGIEAVPHALAGTALEVVVNERRVRTSRAYGDGLVELQDAASQAVVAACLEVADPTRVLDYCAGGGGKALAFAGAGCGDVTTYDAAPERMTDLPGRAARAGTQIRVVSRVEGTYGVVFCDAPCSGSGAWRRQPEAKWTLDQDRLCDLNRQQDDILRTAKAHVAPDGVLAYATCSLLDAENKGRIEAFLAENPDWRCPLRRSWTPLDGGDGFYLAILRRD